MSRVMMGVAAMRVARLAVLAAGLAWWTLLQAAAPDAQPIRPAAPIPAPRDIPFPGIVELSVDATDLTHRIFTVHETVPVQGAGDLVLLYPEWIPGNHAPEGTIAAFAGLMVHTGGATLEWVRDTVNVFAFHVTVPRGVTSVELDYQYLSPVNDGVGPVVVTHDQLFLDWNTVLLYPASYFARRIPVAAHLKLPPGWSSAGALEVAATDGAMTSFRPVPVDTLVDSPLFAGRNYRRYDLAPGQQPAVYLDVFAEQSELMELKPELLAQHRNLVQQAYRLFGSQHFEHYDFLYSLSDTLSGDITLEHQRSAVYGLPANEFTEWNENLLRRDDIPHEFVHSWNGKFRRPADLWTANLNVPMRNSLLWMYEGGTQYWGLVLEARSGMSTPEQLRERLAIAIASLQDNRGRSWRNIQDTTNDELINPRRPMSWLSWQRFEDYYVEGALIWLEADTLIRERSRDQRSLDDFARLFFGVESGRSTPVVYTFEDIVHALNQVEPYDWATFLRSRLNGRDTQVPLQSLQRSGYRLVYTDTPGEIWKALEAATPGQDSFVYSLGFALNKDGDLKSVHWGSPAFKAGLAAGNRIIAVDGVAYDAKRLREILKGSKERKTPVELLIRSDDRFSTVSLDYHEGLRYPHLERDQAVPARLDSILLSRP
jgi:predicted metalloprotease with PDZ domain